MAKDFDKLIKNSDIPGLLKDYLVRNERIKVFIDERLLREIEELYTEYDSLYIFDEAEFCSYIIPGLKKHDKHDYFYHYLKKILEVNLDVFSKSKLDNENDLVKLRETLSNIKESDIASYLININRNIEKYRVNNNSHSLYSAYKLTGMLDILFILYPDNEYKDSYYEISETLFNIE